MASNAHDLRQLVGSTGNFPGANGTIDPGSEHSLVITDIINVTDRNTLTTNSDGTVIYLPSNSVCNFTSPIALAKAEQLTVPTGVFVVYHKIKTG
tara:strand:+ start:897 stop:1181 length:285 start_codon:yes stop_codon:yes gene_type:complete